MNIRTLHIDNQQLLESLSLSAFEMAEEIACKVERLDALRRHMFMEWLRIHSHAIDHSGGLQESLTKWLGSMSAESADWEYELIMGETEWWRDLDEPRLAKIMLECVNKLCR